MTGLTLRGDDPAVHFPESTALEFSEATEAKDAQGPSARASSLDQSGQGFANVALGSSASPSKQHKMTAPAVTAEDGKIIEVRSF